MALDPVVFRGLAGFRYALRRFLAASEAICRAGGVTIQQYQALLAIKAAEGQMSVGDLSEQLMLTHHAAVQMMDRLAKAGLAERRQSPRDRRVVLVHLTTAGEAKVDALATEHSAELRLQEPLLRRSLEHLRHQPEGS